MAVHNSTLPTLSNAISEITLSARNLTRFFGNRQIIHDLTLELKRGEIMGLLGHNGAGKSTTLQMLTGCLIPDSGQIDICGIDLLKNPALAKSHIGYLPESPPLYRELCVEDYLVFAARLRGMKKDRIPDALLQVVQRCGIESVKGKIISTLSKGYQQRVGIAQAIIHRPSVIVLDEPTVGLDPAQKREILNVIRELGETSSVILSTHILSEVESVCDRVEIMQNGKLIYGDSSARMRRYEQAPGFVVSLRNPPALNELKSIAGVMSVEQITGTEFRILHATDDHPASLVLSLAAERGWQLEQLTPLHATLEDVFVRITSDEAQGGETVPARDTPGVSPPLRSDPSAGEKP